MSEDTQTTFKAAYGVLQRHADLLRNQREPNIDDLLRIVTESVDAYNVCQARIAAVDKALDATLNPARQASSQPSAAEPTRPPVGEADDDLPFDDAPFEDKPPQQPTRPWTR